jgi:hypothetical protein
MAKKTSKKASGTRARAGREAKFAGVVKMTPPGGGRSEALANGSHVVVSLAELSVRGLPERGSRSELMFDAVVRTTDGEGRAVGNTWSSGVHYYVRRDSRLNLSEVVLFDGKVHQHLSLDLSLVEVEMPQMKPADAVALAGAAVDAAVTLAEPTVPLGPALSTFPDIFGAILKLNGDDQVLKHSLSLFTKEVRKPEDSEHYLVEGAYRFEKKRAEASGVAWVTLVLDVRAVSP